MVFLVQCVLFPRCRASPFPPPGMSHPQTPINAADIAFREFLEARKEQPDLDPRSFLENVPIEARDSFSRLVEEFFEVGGLFARVRSQAALTA